MLILFNPAISFSEENWEYYEKLGILQYNEGMNDFALQSLTKAIRLNPNAFRSENALGNLLLKSNQKIQAKECFTRSLQINGKQDDIHVILAELEDYYFNIENSKKHFLEAVTINPTNVRAYIGLSRIYDLLNDKTNADASYKKAASFNKTAGDSNLEKARKYLKAHDNVSAEIYYKRTIEINPAETEAYFEISSLYRATNRKIDALKYLERYKYIRPHDDKTYFYISNLYLTGKINKKRLKELEFGLQNILKAIELNNSQPEYFSILSQFYRLLGKSDKADEAEKQYIAALQRVEDTRPPSPD